MPRKAPAAKAKEHPNRVKKGLDGSMWISAKDVNGVYRWNPKTTAHVKNMPKKRADKRVQKKAAKSKQSDPKSAPTRRGAREQPTDMTLSKDMLARGRRALTRGNELTLQLEDHVDLDKMEGLKVFGSYGVRYNSAKPVVGCLTMTMVRKLKSGTLRGVHVLHPQSYEKIDLLTPKSEGIVTDNYHSDDKHVGHYYIDNDDNDDDCVGTGGGFDLTVIATAALVHAMEDDVETLERTVVAVNERLRQEGEQEERAELERRRAAHAAREQAIEHEVRRRLHAQARPASCALL